MSTPACSLRCACLLVLLALGACRTGGRPRPPESDLERALYFVERDHDEELHPLSGAAVETGAAEVVSVPWNHPVDLESRIEVRWDKSKLRPLVGPAEVAPVDALVVPRAERVAALLEALARLAETRAAAIERWRVMEEAAQGSPETAALEEAFDEALAPLVAAKEEFFALVFELYPDGHAQRERVEELFEDMMGAQERSQELRAFLQAEVDDLDRDTRAVVREVRRDFALRLEAFLISDGKEPVALHLEGYDTIAAKRVASIDRFGLALSDAERERLRSLLGSAREIADAANRLAAGEARLEDALDGATGELARRLDDFVTEARALTDEWGTVAEDRAWRATIEAVEPFVDGVLAIVGQELAAERDRLAADARARLERWSEHSTFVAELRAAIELVPRLRDALAGGAPRGDVIDLALALERALRGVADGLDALRGLLGETRALVETARADWERRKPELAAEIEAFFEASALGQELARWHALVARTQALLGPIGRFVGLVEEARPLDASVRVPEAIDVPLDDAPSTTLDLTRTERSPGDRVEVRATLLEQDTVQSSASASFEIEKLGWHADLVPAVVLVTADQLAAADDSGGFTASLSWMLRHGPRPDETGWLAHSSQWLGWGVGLHATLLHFDPDDDVEIGLGTTVGLWGDRLLFGAGVNPLADSDEDGRFYYFVGSSLIPLLQALRRE